MRNINNTISSVEISKLTNCNNKDVMKNIRNDIDKLSVININKYFIKSYYNVVINNGGIRKQPCFLLTLEGVKVYLDNRRKTENLIPLIDWYNKNNNSNKEQIIVYNRPEIGFINKLEESLLLLFDIEGKRQYTVKNSRGTSYRLDYYIKLLNIAIEYDENNHLSYTYEDQEERQKEIENKLGCRFIRVTDKESDEFNIAYILSNIKNELHNYIRKYKKINNDLENFAFAITKMRILINQHELNKNTLEQELFETQIQKEYFDNKLKELIKLKSKNNTYKQINNKKKEVVCDEKCNNGFIRK